MMNTISKLLLCLGCASALATPVPITQFKTDAEHMAYYHVQKPLTPYPPEMVRAGRNQPDYRELEGFESLDGWKLKGTTKNMQLKATAVTRVHGKLAAEIALKERTNVNFELLAPAPIPLRDDENGILLWSRALQYSYSGGPIYKLGIRVKAGDGTIHNFFVPGTPLTFQMWMPGFIHLPNQSEKMPRPWSIVSLTGQIRPRNKVRPPYFVLFDSLQAFPDTMDFPGEKPLLPLPEPTVKDTIRPLPVEPVENKVIRRGRTVTFVATSGDSTIKYIITPKTGSLDDLTIQVNGKSFKPCAGGGPVFELEGELLRPGDEWLTTTLQKATLNNQAYVTTFQARSSVGGDGYTDELTDYSITWSIHGKTLYADFKASQPTTAEINFGRPQGIAGDLVIIPYLRIDQHGPRVLFAKDFYVSALVDHWNSDASKLFGRKDTLNGGAQYGKMTNGKRNPARERLMITASQQFAEVLPNIPNPPSTYASRYASATWRWGMVEWDWAPQLYWNGVRDFQFRTHADLHRDINESYGYCPTAAPSKGEDFIRNLSKSLRNVGFGYAPYNAYTEQNPFVKDFSYKDLRRDAKGNFNTYQLIPAASLRAQETYAPEYVRLYQPTFSYLDVHGCRMPWRATDMRANSWMAGKFRGDFLATAALMRRNSQIFGGPTMTEGGANWLYAGYYDAIYGYIGHGLKFRDLDDIVDFDLLRIKPLTKELGMGDWAMYYKDGEKAEDDYWLRHYVTATLAYGHAAWLSPKDNYLKARIYFLSNAVQRNYMNVPVQFIGYSDGSKIMPSSQALLTSARKKGLIHVTYQNGLKLYANLSKTRETWKLPERSIPAHGFYASLPKEDMEAFSLDYDWVKSKEYTYIHAQAKPVVRPEVTIEQGGAAVRPVDQHSWLLFPSQNLKNLKLNPQLLGLPQAPSYDMTLKDTNGKILTTIRMTGQNGWLTIPQAQPLATCYELKVVK